MRKFTSSQIDLLSKQLKAMPALEKTEFSKKEAIERLAPTIKVLQKMDSSIEEIISLLK